MNYSPNGLDKKHNAATVQAAKRKPTTMPNITQLRQTIGAYLGQLLTPEIAADIESSAEQMPMIPWRVKVERLQDEICNLPQVDFPIRNHFAPGMYAREITIPKGAVLVGAVHKIQNLVVLSKGTLRLFTGEGTLEISAPFTMICQPGAKNSAYAVEESVWTNFYPTDETDLEKLAEMFTESKLCELIGGSENRQMLVQAALHKLEN